MDTYRVGQVLEATVTKLAAFGAFARLQGPVEGLIHISELADRMVQHPREIVREGDRVMVKIVKIEPDRKRIGLSIKQVREDEAAEMASRFRAGEGEHRVERPALSADKAAQLAQAMSAQGGNTAAADGGAEAGAAAEQQTQQTG
jgi:ribosomal protein S1